MLIKKISTIGTRRNEWNVFASEESFKNRIIAYLKYIKILETFLTFISHTLHFIDCFLAILLSKMFGFLHRLSQEFLKLSSDF